MTTIRAAGYEDVERLREIEDAAGEAFRALGMDRVADDPPPAARVLLGFVDRGRAWVSGDAGGPVLAYLLADVVDDCAHVEQVTVHPSAARRGLGAALVEHAVSWARSWGAPALTLVTFTEVPWNGPYYERLGFRYVADDELGPALRSLRRMEAARGLDRWPRAAMRRELASRSPDTAA